MNTFSQLDPVAKRADVAARVEDGLTFSEVIRDLPVDPGSIFALVLVLGFLAMVLYFGSRSPR